ncbi:hypothetical protein [Pseudonocardia sp. T1-2H]|uniref:hypothetical protein n=1 Tax=Pseudonocardia sp. T1-2H TaxID=3128899 RepID=UPI0031013AE5
MSSVTPDDGPNWWEIGLVGAGLLLQIIGAVFTIRGIFLVWAEVARPGERFRDLLIEQVQMTRKKLTDLARKISRRQPAPKTLAGAGFAAAFGTAHGDAHVAFGTLPEETPDAIAELNIRVNRLHDMIQKVQTDARQEARDRDAAVSALGDALRGEMTARADEDRAREVKSLRAEIGGFWFITIGFVIGGIGSLIGALT